MGLPGSPFAPPVGPLVVLGGRWRGRGLGDFRFSNVDFRMAIRISRDGGDWGADGARSGGVGAGYSVVKEQLQIQRALKRTLRRRATHTCAKAHPTQTCAKAHPTQYDLVIEMLAGN